MPPRSLRVLQRAAEVNAILSVAMSDSPGGAMSASAISGADRGAAAGVGGRCAGRGVRRWTRPCACWRTPARAGTEPLPWVPHRVLPPPAWPLPESAPPRH